jgi:drug/metabolite transporter (DMT)-like permease
MAALVAVIWGLCFVLIQAALPSPAPLLLAALRALIGGGVLAACVVLRPVARRPRTAQSSRSAPRSGLPSMPVLIALAVANAALALGAMYLAAGQAEAAVASILGGGQPLVLAAAGWALFGERASRRSVAGLAVAMVGVVLVATGSSGATSLDGVGLALLATAAPAAGTVLMRRVAPTVDLLATTSAQFLLGGAILLAASVVFEPWGSVSWSPAMLLGLFVLGVLGTGLAYVAWFWLLDRVSLVRLGAALFLVPVVGIVAAIVTGERPGGDELAGIAALLVGIGIVSVGGPSASRADEPARQTA